MVKSGVKTFSSGEMEALSALCDTFLPSIDVPTQDHRLRQFYHSSASMAGTPSLVAETLKRVQHPKLPLARLAITLLSTWIGTFILCGRESLSAKFPYLQRFSEVSSHKRQKILLSWSTSYFFLLRILFVSLKVLILLKFFTQVNEKNENLSWKAIGYCGPDPEFKARKPEQGADEEEAISEEEVYGPLHKRTINFSEAKEASLNKLHTLGFPPSELQPKSAAIKRLSPSFVVKCDAVVVGSGSGGGVVAGVLANAGYKVVVVEKGSYAARSNLSLLEGQSMDEMYMQGGLVGTHNMNVLMLAGSTVGGGSTINWSASIPTPQHVRKEWSEKHDLQLFDSKVYDQALDVVSRKMGVQAEVEREGFNNEVLRKGCKNLGYHVENIPRNAPPDHYCGWCCLGCKDGRKQGAAETWLVDLVNSNNGAILSQCEATKVIVEKQKGRKRAVGVAFRFQTPPGGEEIGVVEARVVVAACGALCTPAFLRRSGLKNPNIGRNLHLHPVVNAWGYFPDSAWPKTEKRSYEGGIMTAMSKVAGNFESSGYGAVIQTPSLHPGMFSALMPWTSGLDMKNRMVRFSRTAHVFALARDRGSGFVASETDIRYKLGRPDQENLAAGTEKVLRILAAAGAEEIGTHHRTGKVLRVKEASPEEFERFVKEESLRPFEKLSAPVCSAHQMGSCRMGVDPMRSAVGPTGETWEVEGLFVADSSVFPTALGVNPMLTIQAISYCTAHSLLQSLANASY